jgi:transcription-repair coupling factor (superfamily II helicase)
MNYLFDFLNQDKSFSRAIAAYTADTSQTMIYGLSGSTKNALIAAGFARSPRATLLIAGSQEPIDHYRFDFETLLPGVTVLELPATDMITFSADAKSLDLAAKRMNVLSVMAAGQPVIILATVGAAMQKVLPLTDFLNNRVILSDHGVLDRDDLLSILVRFGYERTDEVNSAGQFAARGGIIDVFPLSRDYPVRLELFGDEVDSLRDFDPHTQRSIRAVTTVVVLPIIEPELSGKLTDLFEYLPAKATVVFDEPSRVREQLTRLV